MSVSISVVAQELISNNERWAAGVTRTWPSFFRDSIRGQEPGALWIGCSDSRVPETTILGNVEDHPGPGKIFVTRNIGNQFHPQDLSVRTVLAFSVLNLGVDNIIVCGHTHCGAMTFAVNTVLGDEPTNTSAPPSEIPGNLLVEWLELAIERVKALHAQGLSREEIVNIIEEENMRLQVLNVARNKVVQQIFREGKRPLTIHGWLYHLETGRVRPVLSVDRDTDLEKITATA